MLGGGVASDHGRGTVAGGRHLPSYRALIGSLSGDYPSLGFRRGAAGGYNWDGIHRSNAEQAREWADGSKEVAIDLLRRHSDTLANTLRSLTDAQLDHSSVSPLTGEQLTTAQFAEGMIAHARIHLTSARATVARQ
jgi:hypothetical protein